MQKYHENAHSVRVGGAVSKEKGRAYIKYITALLLFGSNGIIASFIDLPSEQIILLRTFLGGSLLMMIAAAMRSFRGISAHGRDSLFVILSGLCMGVSWIFQYEAYRLIGIGVTSVLYCIGPILLVILAQFVFRERITSAKVLCLSAVTAGAVLTGGMTLQQGAGAAGIICALMCALAYAGMILLNKQSRHVTGLANASIQMAAAFSVTLIFSLLKIIAGQLPALSNNAITDLNVVMHGVTEIFATVTSLGEWTPVLILGMINTGIGCYLYFSSISEIPAQTVAVCDYIEPMSAVLLSAIILGEHMSAFQIAGTSMILAGTIAWNRRSAADNA